MTNLEDSQSMFPNMHGDTSATSVTDKKIDEFEKSRNINLPTLYRLFLKSTNGGIPDRALYPITGMENNPHGGIQCFFGIDKELEVDTIEWNYDMCHGRIPREIVMIAGNGGSDYICLDLRNAADRVVFWDFRHFWGTGEWRESDVYQIADSFKAFLAVLKTR